MFLAEPNPTPYDLHFRLLGISVRISPWFWVANLLLGWDFATGISRNSEEPITAGAVLLIWTVAVLFSIVIHEMGHALAFRCFGIHSHIVLYHFGGIAVPDSTGGLYRYQHEHPLRQIFISVAGPGAQMLVALLLLVSLYLAGFRSGNPVSFFHPLDFLRTGAPLPALALRILVFAFGYCSIWWAILNLLPVYPLDGGQIAREVVTLFNPREGIRVSLILSIVTAAAVALWAFQQKDTFMGLMFLSLGYSSYMTLHAYFGGGRGFGGDQW